MTAYYTNFWGIKFSQTLWKGKGKGNMTYRHTRGMGIKIHAFLTSGLDKGELSASCSSHINSRERILSTLWIAGCLLLKDHSNSFSYNNLHLDMELY
jgi:hypothetical protein